MLLIVITCSVMLNTVLDQDNLGWRHKDGIGARTQVSFIKTALVWAACNSSESLVLTVVWQDSDSLDSGRERWFNKDFRNERERCLLLKVTIQISKPYCKPTEGVLAQSTQSHWGSTCTPHHSLHCTHQGSQALGYK